jgi:mannose-6-phosphate isomerase
MSSPLYPFRFVPILRRYLWGGRRLESMLGKRLGEGNDYAESWELVDRGADQSVVAAGPLAGTTLGELVRQRGPELLGRHDPQPRFPLLFKFLDAAQPLSVQVHPDDARAARLDPPDLGKAEAWVVLAAEPGSVLYAGLKQGTDRRLLQRELARGTCELVLKRIVPAVGDCVFLPAGVPHAIGAGLVIAELQQSSDTTWRLFDWDRLGPDGRPRTLHVEEALEAIDFERATAAARPPAATDRPHVQRLAACDQFVLDRHRVHGRQTVGGDDRCHFLAVVGGSVAVEGDRQDGLLAVGGTVLVPACCGTVMLEAEGESTVLDAYLP